MQTYLPILGQILSVLAAGLWLPGVARCEERPKSSLPELDIERAELKVTLDKAIEDNRQLRAALAETSGTLSEMRKNLAATNGETEVFRRQALELKKRFEALGSSATGDTKKIEQRLLTAVSDLQQLEADKKLLSEALVRLSETILRFSRSVTSGDPEARLALEAEMRNANQALGVAPPLAVDATAVPSTLTDGMVISVKEDLALVVINLGSKQGVKVGMPFQVIREDRTVGTVRVVEVREKLAGAVIQNLSLENDHIKVGDRLRVAAQR